MIDRFESNIEHLEENKIKFPRDIAVFQKSIDMYRNIVPKIELKMIREIEEMKLAEELEHKTSLENN